MNRIALLVISFIFLAGIAFAENTARIAEIDNEIIQLQERAQTLQNQSTQIQTAFDNIRIRILQLKAIKDELQKHMKEK